MVDCMGWQKLPELQGLEEVIAWVDGNCQNYRGWKRLLHGLTETARSTGVGRGYCMGWRKLPELQGLEEVIAWVDGNCQKYRGWKRLLHGLTETARTTGVGRGYCMGWRKLPELQGLEEVTLHQRSSLSYTAGRENNVTSWSHNFKQGYPWDFKKVYVYFLEKLLIRGKGVIRWLLMQADFLKTEYWVQVRFKCKSEAFLMHAATASMHHICMLHFLLSASSEGPCLHTA